MKARKLYAYGEQRDYFDDPKSIGWTRFGTLEHPHGCGVVMSISGSSTKRMYVGPDTTGQIWIDLLRNVDGRIVIDHDGYGTFSCGKKSASVFVDSAAIETLG